MEAVRHLKGDEMMKRRTRTFPALALLGRALPAVAAAQGFEGTVRIRTVVMSPGEILIATGAFPGTDPDPATLSALATPESARTDVTTFSIKGDRVRMDYVNAFDGRSARWALLDAGGGGMTIVIPDEEQTMWVPTTAVGAPAGPGGAAAAAPEPTTTAARVGAMTMLGTPATGWQWETGETLTRFWGTDGRPGVAAALHAMGSAIGLPGVLPTTEGSGASLRSLVPMRVESIAPVPERATYMMGRGLFFTRTEIVAIEERRLDDALFRLPTGFEAITVRGGR